MARLGFFPYIWLLLIYPRTGWALSAAAWHFDLRASCRASKWCHLSIPFLFTFCHYTAKAPSVTGVIFFCHSRVFILPWNITEFAQVLLPSCSWSGRIVKYFTILVRSRRICNRNICVFLFPYSHWIHGSFNYIVNKSVGLYVQGCSL